MNRLYDGFWAVAYEFYYQDTRQGQVTGQLLWDQTDPMTYEDAYNWLAVHATGLPAKYGLVDVFLTKARLVPA